MGEKDITERTLESYNDVFADIVNVLLFDGKRIICENELEDAISHSQYKADGKIHLVLYFGYEHRWNKPASLLKCLEIPKGLEPFVSDYNINIFEIAWLTDEKVDMFKSDFRIVADYGGQYLLR